jgi:hypothetical protein
VNELKKKYEKEEDYTRSMMFRDRFDELSSQESMRQTENMRLA